MTFEIIEPTPRRIPTSDQRREIASRVHQCSKWLRIQGFRVMAAVGGMHQSHIFIERDDQLCSMLEGAAEGYERTRLGERRYQFVVRFGCMVRWEIGGAA